MDLAYVYDMLIFMKTFLLLTGREIVTLKVQYKGHLSASIAVTLKCFCFFAWKLLEERDTLQLRLSNALRMNEELRDRNRALAVSSPDTTAEQLQSREQMPQNIEASISLPSSASTTVQEPQEDLQVLSNK
jgi:hypothetical protein